MVKIELIGNIGADVQRVDANGTTFFTFNVCDNRRVGDTEQSQWYACNLNRPSDKLLQYLVKGQQVFVRGVPRYRIFDSAKYRCKMVAVDVFVDEIQLIGAAPKPAEQPADAPANDDVQVF